MKLTNLLLALFIVAFATNSLFAQKSQTLADSIYDEGVTFYSQNQLTEAVAKFEEALTINPKHKNSLFNLGVIYFEYGNKEKGLAYLQTGVKHGDRDAAELLKFKLQQRIAYADTMHFEDVDVAPRILVKGVPEDILVNGDFHPVLKKQLVAGFKKSSIILKDSGAGKLYPLQIHIDKDGKLNGILIKPYGKSVSDEKPIVQEEISAILRAIPNILPAKHDGKAVSVNGFAIPFRVTNHR